MGAAILMLAGMLAFDDPPKDVINFFASMTSALVDAGRDLNARERQPLRDAADFLQYFDPSMPGYAEFSSQIQDMVGAGEVQTTIDFVSTEGDDRKRVLDLDWVLTPEGQRPKRAVIKCTIEKHGRKWKVTSIAPIDFFKRD